jgi:hypothetical protein
MRIPTSVIVMSLLTAAPFGLAIRDTLKRKGAGLDEYDPDGRKARIREREAEIAEYERESAREAEERERQKASRLEKLDMIYGSTPASMGSMFDGIVLGADSANYYPDTTAERVRMATRDGFMNVVFDADTRTLNSVKVEIDTYAAGGDVCETLREKLESAWGRGVGSVWTDPVKHQRAHVDRYTCTLTFERYLDAAEWVAALPIDVIGKPSQPFIDTLPSPTQVEDGLVTWNQPGIGTGQRGTAFEVYYAKGKVVGFKASGSTDYDSIVALRDGLTEKLKVKPTTSDEDEGLVTWKRRVPVKLEHLDDRFVVLVGTMPWE